MVSKSRGRKQKKTRANDSSLALVSDHLITKLLGALQAMQRAHSHLLALELAPLLALELEPPLVPLELLFDPVFAGALDALVTRI